MTTIQALKATLLDNTVDEIVVANGTYIVSASSSQLATSLWMGAQHASRTRPITVRAETIGGVTLSGGGSQNWNGLSFQDGAHDMTWDGFKFANGRPLASGVIGFGGYGLPAAHHITLRNMTILPSIAGDPTSNKDHGIYFSSDGAHDILIEDLTVTPGVGIESALHFFHSPNSYNVTIRRMHVTGTQQAIILWDPTLRNIVIEDSTITNARIGVRYEEPGSGIVLRRVTTIGAADGFYSSLGENPPGVTFIDCSFQ